jgi:hypothetical protein
LSGIIVVGAMLQPCLPVPIQEQTITPTSLLGALAVSSCQHQHLRWLRSHRADAGHVQEEKEVRSPTMQFSLNTLTGSTCRRHPVHPDAAGLSSPLGAIMGNRYGMIGMLLAVLTPLPLHLIRISA